MAGLVIRMFLVDGQPEGLRTMELSNATVLGTFFPRPALSRFLQRQPATRPGVYILLGVEPEAAGLTSERIYIGEGDPVGPRLQTHGVQKDFWTQAAVFTSKDDYLSKTQIQFLEASLIHSARSVSKATLDNGTVPNHPKVSEADHAEVQSFLSHVQMLLGVAGYRFFRPDPELSQIPTDAQQEFHFRVKDAEAAMVRTTSAYVVRKGSTAQKLQPSASPYLIKARQQLEESGALEEDSATLLRFTRDVEFDSPSGAAMVIAGRSANGRISWCLPDGKALKEVEESEV